MNVMLVSKGPSTRKMTKQENYKIACLNDIALLPTDGPIALATSLAPIPNAMKKPANPAIIRIKVGSRNKVSIII